MFSAIFTVLKIDQYDINNGDYRCCFNILLENHPTRNSCRLWVGSKTPVKLEVGKKYTANMSSQPLHIGNMFLFHLIVSEVVPA